MSMTPKKTRIIVKTPKLIEDTMGTIALKLEANIGQLGIMTRIDCINEIYSIISENISSALDLNEAIESKDNDILGYDGVFRG